MFLAWCWRQRWGDGTGSCGGFGDCPDAPGFHSSRVRVPALFFCPKRRLTPPLTHHGGSRVGANQVAGGDWLQLYHLSELPRWWVLSLEFFHDMRTWGWVHGEVVEKGWKPEFAFFCCFFLKYALQLVFVVSIKRMIFLAYLTGLGGPGLGALADMNSPIQDIVV